MNILITGGSGFIGSHLVSKLNKNNNVYIYDLKETSNKIKFIKGSILDSKKIKKRKGIEKESYIFIIYITFNIAGGGFYVFFDDKLTTFRNKDYRFICNVEKVK